MPQESYGRKWRSPHNSARASVGSSWTRRREELSEEGDKLAKECEYFDEDYKHFGGDEAPRAIWNCTHPKNNPCPEGFEGTCCASCFDDCVHKCARGAVASKCARARELIKRNGY